VLLLVLDGVMKFFKAQAYWWMLFAHLEIPIELDFAIEPSCCLHLALRGAGNVYPRRILLPDISAGAVMSHLRPAILVPMYCFPPI